MLNLHYLQEMPDVIKVDVVCGIFLDTVCVRSLKVCLIMSAELHLVINMTRTSFSVTVTLVGVSQDNQVYF